MSVLVVDIPPQYGMLLSRKWSAEMGGSIQCDLSHATFQIGENSFKVNRDPNSVYMIEQDVEDDITYFVDIDVNAFRAKFLILNKEAVKAHIVVEAKTKSVRGDL